MDNTASPYLLITRLINHLTCQPDNLTAANLCNRSTHATIRLRSAAYATLLAITDEVGRSPSNPYTMDNHLHTAIARAAPSRRLCQRHRDAHRRGAPRHCSTARTATPTGHAAPITHQCSSPAIPQNPSEGCRPHARRPTAHAPARTAGTTLVWWFRLNLHDCTVLHTHGFGINNIPPSPTFVQDTGQSQEHPSAPAEWCSAPHRALQTLNPPDHTPAGNEPCGFTSSHKGLEAPLRHLSAAQRASLDALAGILNQGVSACDTTNFALFILLFLVCRSSTLQLVGLLVAPAYTYASTIQPTHDRAWLWHHAGRWQPRPAPTHAPSTQSSRQPPMHQPHHGRV